VNDPRFIPTGNARDERARVFREPWEAQAFAMTLELHQRGLFTWAEWAAALVAQIASAQAAGNADLGDTYYRHWLAALEALVAAKGASSSEELRSYRNAWEHAADRTPHGQPIDLQPGDFESPESRDPARTNTVLSGNRSGVAQGSRSSGPLAAGHSTGDGVSISAIPGPSRPR
jgi:nitrile hydratase accessory protein